MMFLNGYVASRANKSNKSSTTTVQKYTCMARGDYCAVYGCFNDRFHSMSCPISGTKKTHAANSLQIYLTFEKLF